MKKFTTLFIIAFIVCKAEAQDTSANFVRTAGSGRLQIAATLKPPPDGWRKGLNFSLGLTQVGNSNWIATGGDKFTFSTAASLNAFASLKFGRKTWDNILDVNYGLLNTTSLGVRKLNDRIDFTSKLGYKPGKWKNFRLSLLGQLRSELTTGYQYDYFGTTTKRRSSGFFAPAYIIIAPGIDWSPTRWLSIFGSPVATRWTVISNGPYSYAGQGGVFYDHLETPLATLYGVDPAKENRGEFGAFVTASARKEILKNVTYITKLDLYSNYLGKAANIDVFWTNQFKLRVNNFIQVSYSIDLLYDDDVRNPKEPSHALGLQTLSTLGIGFSLSCWSASK